MKKTGLFIIATLFAVACGGGENKLVPDKKFNYKYPTEEWLNWPKEWKELHTHLYQQADPYSMFGSTYYKTTWQIELIGTLRDFYLDDNPSLTIMYRYIHLRE